MPKSPFIEGFKQPTLSKNSFVILSDVRGDGEGKLLIWSEQQRQLIVYKGSNREVQHPVKLKHVTGIIQYYDQDISAQPVIGLSAQNALYIFRGLAESFRLRIPDVFASPEQQILWSQYQNQPQRLTSELMNLDKKVISESAKYFIGATTIEKKRQLIQKAFSDGINEKDSISAMTVIKQHNSNAIGNVVLGTELKRLHILDNYGHRIIQTKIINYVPSFLMAFGTFEGRYMIISIGRQGSIQIYGKSSQPMEIMRISTRVVASAFSFPQMVIATADQVVTKYAISNSNFKIGVKKWQMKLNYQPVKLQFLKTKNQSCLIIGFQDQFRIYNQNQLIYQYKTSHKLYNIIYGPFSREQGCLILLYQTNGFQVLILHRQFSAKQNYGTNKKVKDQQQQTQQIPFPKKTSHFLSYWKGQPDTNISYKLYEKNIRLLKWRTLKDRLKDKGIVEGKVQINPKIQGLGPVFLIKLEIENISDQPIYQIDVLFSYQKNAITINKGLNRLMMLAPFTPCQRQIEVRSESLKNQQITVQLSWGDSLVSSIINIPNCQEMGQ